MRLRYVLLLIALATGWVGYFDSPAPGQDVKCNCILDEDD